MTGLRWNLACLLTSSDAFAPWFQEWLKETNLELDEGGFIAVSPSLESLNCADVFAAGDVAGVVKYPRPKAGVFAVRQGPPLLHNLRARLLGRPTKPFVPQVPLPLPPFDF